MIKFNNIACRRIKIEKFVWLKKIEENKSLNDIKNYKNKINLFIATFENDV